MKKFAYTLALLLTSTTAASALETDDYGFPIEEPTATVSTSTSSRSSGFTLFRGQRTFFQTQQRSQPQRYTYTQQWYSRPTFVRTTNSQSFISRVTAAVPVRASSPARTLTRPVSLFRSN